MPYQNISVSMPQADIDTVKTAIATINSKMNFLITLQPEERQSLIKTGSKSVDFVQDASIAATNFPSIFPASFNVAEFKKDAALFQIITDLKQLVDSLHEKLEHTEMAIGSEAMTAALEAYAYVQVAADRTPGLQSLADKLKDRFKRSKSKKSDAGQQ